MAKRAIRLSDSDKILLFPAGDIDKSTLESLLQEITTRQLDRTRLVIVTKDKRFKNFNIDHPRYYTEESRMTVARLQEMYKRINRGHEFTPLTEYQLENRYKIRPVQF